MPESFEVRNPEDVELRTGTQRGNRTLAWKILAFFVIGLIVTIVVVLLATWVNSPAAPVVLAATSSTTSTTTSTTTTSTTTLMTSTSFDFPPPVPEPGKPSNVLKGIAYGPVPLKTGGTVPNDDFFSDHTEPLWGSAGRHDLMIMKEIGANAVRLYGNDPRYSHGKFLDEAYKMEMGVVVGFSDYPYTQAPGNCVWSNGFDCFQHIKDQYVMMLKDGQFLVQNLKQYHSALEDIILINEPELKMGGLQHVEGWSKAVVSAFDGALEAEKEFGLSELLPESLPKFTATFSYAVCGQPCGSLGYRPALGQMVALQKAMIDPALVGYTARNDLSKAYQERFVNSFNTANPASDIPPQFLQPYQEHFGYKEVYIGEFHKPGSNNLHEMQRIMEIAADKRNPLRGVAFFEFQVRYDKGGSEMEFGMFGLGDEVVGQVTLGDSGQQFDIMCLTEQWDTAAGMSVPAAVATAYGGPGVDAKHLCPKNVETQLTI